MPLSAVLCRGTTREALDKWYKRWWIRPVKRGKHLWHSYSGSTQGLYVPRLGCCPCNHSFYWRISPPRDGCKLPTTCIFIDRKTHPSATILLKTLANACWNIFREYFSAERVFLYKSCFCFVLSVAATLFEWGVWVVRGQGCMATSTPIMELA